MLVTTHIETVCLLGREIVNDKNVEYAHVDYEPKDAEYLKSAKGSASYREIKEWIKEQHDVSVSNLNIAQVKDKLGFGKRENYNKGAETARFLTDICHREDPTRPVTAGFNSHNNAIKNGLADVVDIVGFNYKPHDYKNKHEKFPDYIIYGSETASTVSSRGVYKFPVKEWKSAYYDDYHVSSYDLEYPGWASTPDTEFLQQDECSFIAGELFR